QRVFEGKLSIDEGFEVGARNRHLQLMPLISRQVPRLPSRTTPYHFPDAVPEGPQRNVVLGVVIARGEPVAIGLDIEQDAGAAIEVAGNRLELEADGAVREIIQAVERRDRVICELLDVIDKILLRSVVEAARALSEQRCTVVLVRLPGLAIHHDDLVLAILNDAPCADDGLKRYGRLADALLAQVHPELGGGKPARRKRRNGETGCGDHEVAARQSTHASLLLCKNNPRPITARGHAA